MLDSKIMSNIKRDATLSAEEEVSNFITPEFVAVVKVENEDSTEGTSETEKHQLTIKRTPSCDKQDYATFRTNEQSENDGNRIHIKTEDDPLLVGSKTSSANPFELAAVVKVENEVTSDDETKAAAKLKQSVNLTSNSKRRLSEIYLIDAQSGVNAVDQMDIKGEDYALSVGNKRSGLSILNLVAVVKVESECESGNKINETGNSADVIETDLVRQIITEKAGMNPTDAVSSVEYISSNASSSPVADHNILIKKEEDPGLKDVDANDEVFQVIVKSNYGLSLVKKGLFKCEEEPVTSYSQTDEASTRERYGNGCEDSLSEIVDDKPSHQSQSHRDYYFSNGFKLAHVSVVLENLSSHSIQKRFLCKYCPSRFKHKYHMKFHSKKHMHENSFSCTFCHAKFSQNVSLKRHLRIHLNEKPFLCKHCPTKFSRRDCLESHMKIHTNAQPFLCPQCGAKFKQKRYLRHHLTTHSNEKPFLCTLCPAKFSRNIGLKRHLRGHNNEKPFPCRFCPVKFTRKDALKSHLKSHNLQKVSCAHCGAEFDQKRYLRDHLSTCESGIVCE